MAEGAERGRRSEGGTRSGLAIMRWVARHAPLPVADAALWAISLAYAARPGRPENRASEAYLSRVLGRRPRFAERHAHARSFAHVFLDRVRFLETGLDGFDVSVTNRTTVERHLEGERGVVLLGAHFGSFEVLRAFDRLRPELVVRYAMDAAGSETSTALLAAVNPEVAARVIPLARGGPAAMLDVHAALMAGEAVAFLGDRVPPGAEASALAVPFLGGRLRVARSPFVAAMAAEVPVILCTAPRTGTRRYAIEFATLHDGRSVPRAERRDRVEALAGAYAAHLEALCRRHPLNWFNFVDLWGGDTLHGTAPGDGEGRARRRRDAA